MFIFLKLISFLFYFSYLLYSFKKGHFSNEQNYMLEKKNKKNIYEIYDSTDNNIELHSIYGSKCSKCHRLVGEFDFKSLGPLKCTGYPRLIRLSNYWNNNWILGVILEIK